MTLQLTVDREGRVRSLDVATPTDAGSFESQLRRTAMDWRFEPARDPSGNAVTAVTEISFSF